MTTRRKFLFAASSVPFLSMPRLFAAPEASAYPPVPALDASRIKPSDFADKDLDMPFALSHFAQVANAVETDGPDRGFIDISVWRGTKQLHPYNARIMESILTLTWFYTAPQKWNQYRANAALRARLELALTYWCNLQSPDGKFSEYGPQQWNLAATAFAVKFMSESLRLLKNGPPIADALHRRAIDCCRKAVRATLFDPDLMSHGRSYSNQYTNIFAGGAAFLALYPDAELSKRLAERVETSGAELQSPCGYMYEKDGPDLGYTLNTHHENLQMAYNYWRGTHLGDLLVEEENRFSKWLMYNLLPEPGQNFFVANRSIETRQKHAIFDPIDTPLADRCIIMRAYATSPDLRAAQIHAAREKLDSQWPQVDPLRLGEFEALSPYLFLQRANYAWHPTAEQMTEARKQVRPLAEQSFVEQLRDTRKPIVFTYVRQPGYYAAFASAPRPVSEQQRLGLTFVWTPAGGVLLQSQTGGAETAWGTSGGDAKPFEAAGLDAAYSDGNTAVRYPLPGGGEKKVAFGDDRILVTVERSGDIVERVPVFDPRCVVSKAQITVAPQESSPVPGKNFAVVELRGSEKLEYEIRPVAS
ncbi:MAG TPA: hypothetical protein VHX20_02210 [Terracidiphilus sp.]|jgi:hypothetical protein|nr:hypothetical protein [Terracidiphilus sp.]